MGSLTGDGEVHRRVSLADQDSLATGLQVRIEVEVLEPTIRDAHTARVRITTTNEGRRRALSVGTGPCRLFNRETSTSNEPPGLILHAPDSSHHIDRETNRWVRDTPPATSRAFRGYGCPPRVFEPGESVSDEYVVWQDYQVAGYLRPGTYRWETPIQIWDGPATEHAEPTTSHWGFSLLVQEPDSLTK